MGASVNRSDRLKGTRVGQYEIVRLLGHGASASVFEAKHVALGKLAALKLLHEHLATDPQIAKRFVREGRVAAKMNHPNAISVLDVGEEGGVPYLVMELLRGVDLRAHLAAEGPLDLAQALTVLLPIAAALQHAHAAGVLHRDVKPGNVFLARDVRDDVVPKLLDFGLSKIMTGSDHALTQSELVAGTAQYMAPEQTFGVKNASAASDQYSLAAVLYECVTGKPPFGDEGTVYDIIERVRSATPRPPSASRRDLAAGFDEVILRALAHDPNARFQSVKAFAQALVPFAGEGAHTRDFADRSGESAPKLAPSPAVHRGSGRMRSAAEAPGPASSIIRGTVPPLPCAPGMSPFHIKGLFYKGFLHQVETLLGMDAFCEALPDSALRFFVRQPFVASGRYDVLPFVPLVDTLARRLGKSMEELVTIGAASQARHDAKTVYKLIFDTKHPEEIADRTRRFNAQIYDFGTFGGSITRPNHILIDFSGIPAYLRPWFGTMHVQYAVECMRLAGSADVAIVSHVVRDAGVREGFPLAQFLTELRWS